MSILLMVFIVIILLCIACYIVQILPSPGPPFAKPVLTIICCAVAFYVIAERSGLLK